MPASRPCGSSPHDGRNATGATGSRATHTSLRKNCSQQPRNTPKSAHMGMPRTPPTFPSIFVALQKRLRRDAMCNNAERDYAYRGVDAR